jgi:hypothetical protein
MAALEPKFLAKAPRRRNAPPGRGALGHTVHLQADVQVAPARHLHVGPHLQVGPQPQDIPSLSAATPIVGELESRSLAVEFICCSSGSVIGREKL